MGAIHFGGNWGDECVDVFFFSTVKLSKSCNSCDFRGANKVKYEKTQPKGHSLKETSIVIFIGVGGEGGCLS
jgi:hypothetical protein